MRNEKQLKLVDLSNLLVNNTLKNRFEMSYSKKIKNKKCHTENDDILDSKTITNKSDILKKFPGAKPVYISYISLKNAGNMIKTEGVILSITDFYPELIEGVYRCKFCRRIHIKTEIDKLDKNFKRCIYCGNNLDTYKLDQKFMDFKELELVDISNNRQNKIIAYAYEENAEGEYLEGDYVELIAKVYHLPQYKKTRFELKIEEINVKGIDYTDKIPKKSRKKSRFQKERSSKQYREWRERILELDNYVCKKCYDYFGNRKGLEAHHIYNFSSYPDLWYDFNNGIALCKKCHKLFHRIYGNKYNDEYQLKEFLRLNQYIDY